MVGIRKVKTVAVNVCFLDSTFHPKLEFRASKIPRVSRGTEFLTRSLILEMNLPRKCGFSEC